MRNKKIKILAVIIVLTAVFSGFYIYRRARSSSGKEAAGREVSLVREEIKNIVSTTAVVLPKNRLEIKPPVNGRIESIMVKEGDEVKPGQVLAWMSSTERAALLDAARGKGEKELEYWQQVYKAIPLLSPIDGEVIVATTQPGQTVTASDAVIVLSDRLIVRAQVDEADIGKIKVGQTAYVALDAYPDTKVKTRVEHIYYESTTINNVTMYQVDLLATEVPDFFRSGMNATVDFIISSKPDALVVPEEAVSTDKGESYVMVKESSAPGGIEKRRVGLGIRSDKKVEITSGLNINDTIIIKSQKYTLPKAQDAGTSPFMPQRRPAQRQQN